MAPLPLSGVVVLDCARMLPGAVLARMLRDLGARVIKVEDPRSGDMMRYAPPLVDGVGAGFSAFYRGTESVTIDLRDPQGAQALRGLAARADVLVESFRPGTMEKWDLGYDRLALENRGLIYCALSGFGQRGGMGDRVGHDLNFVAASGLLSLLPQGDRLPETQFADVASGMLAASSVLAALLVKARTGEGTRVDQPLAVGPLPFLAWPMADRAAGGEGLTEHLLAGEAPCYRVYTCADGRRVALGAIEPKFWQALMAAMGLEACMGEGLTVGPAGEAAAAEVAARFATAPAAHWLALAEAENLPLSAVNDLASAAQDPYYQAQTSFTPTWRPIEASGAPALGEGTARVMAEFGL